MRCTELPLARLGLVSALVLSGLACGGDQGTRASGDFDVYVPSATPVVRVEVNGASRTPIQVSSALLAELGAVTAGQPKQFQIVADPGGRVFGLEAFDGVLRGFDQAGEPIVWSATGEETLTFARPPLGLGIYGGNLLVSYAYPGQIRLVSPSGEIVNDLELETSPWNPIGLGDDTYVASQLETGVVGRYALDSSEIARYTVFQFPEEQLGGDPHLWPYQDFVVGRERVYVTTAEAHQVTAFDIEGNNVWVLEGETERIPIPENISGKTLGRSRRAGRAAGSTLDTEYAQVKWPEFYPALARIATDAQDRLYVFPYILNQNLDRYPVDVYDASGAPILRGWLPFQGWDAFSADAVYRIEERDGAVVVVRYELDLQAAPAGASAGQ